MNVLRLDKTTGLILPKADSQMKLAIGETVPVPNDGYFLHPETGRVMSMANNLAYDTHNSKFIPTVDMTISKYSQYYVPVQY